MHINFSNAQKTFIQKAKVENLGATHKTYATFRLEFLGPTVCAVCHIVLHVKLDIGDVRVAIAAVEALRMELLIECTENRARCDGFLAFAAQELVAVVHISHHLVPVRNPQSGRRGSLAPKRQRVKLGI